MVTTDPAQHPLTLEEAEKILAQHPEDLWTDLPAERKIEIATALQKQDAEREEADAVLRRYANSALTELGPEQKAQVARSLLKIEENNNEAARWLSRNCRELLSFCKTDGYQEVVDMLARHTSPSDSMTLEEFKQACTYWDPTLEKVPERYWTITAKLLNRMPKQQGTYLATALYDILKEINLLSKTRTHSSKYVELVLETASSCKNKDDKIAYRLFTRAKRILSLSGEEGYLAIARTAERFGKTHTPIIDEVMNQAPKIIRKYGVEAYERVFHAMEPFGWDGSGLRTSLAKNLSCATYHGPDAYIAIAESAKSLDAKGMRKEEYAELLFSRLGKIKQEHLPRLLEAAEKISPYQPDLIVPLLREADTLLPKLEKQKDATPDRLLVEMIHDPQSAASVRKAIDMTKYRALYAQKCRRFY